jgi:uncharacterized RDD family membrane protein YckC
MQNPIVYAGFWYRVGAALVDGILLAIIIYPILFFIYGEAYLEPDQPLVQGPADFFLNWIFPAVAVILFWMRWQATPGKMAIRARIVDATTGERVPTGRLILRYLGYFAASLPLLLGIIWIAFDRRKQGWHDKIAGTVVIRDVNPEPVRFQDEA